MHLRLITVELLKLIKQYKNVKDQILTQTFCVYRSRSRDRGARVMAYSLVWNYRPARKLQNFLPKAQINGVQVWIQNKERYRNSRTAQFTRWAHLWNTFCVCSTAPWEFELIRGQKDGRTCRSTGKNIIVVMNMIQTTTSNGVWNKWFGLTTYTFLPRWGFLYSSTKLAAFVIVDLRRLRKGTVKHELGLVPLANWFLNDCNTETN
jgi:hypothetical protein